MLVAEDAALADLDAGRPQDDGEQDRQEEQDHRHGQLRRQRRGLLLGRVHAHVAAFGGEHAQRMRHRRAVAFRLDQRLRDRFHRFQAGAVGEVLIGLAALLKVRQLGVGEHELLRQIDGLHADLVGDAAQRGFDRHARFHADQQQVERVGPRHLDRLLALRRPVGDVENRQVEPGIGAGDADEHAHQERLFGETAEHHDIDQRQREADEGQHEPEEQELG